MRLVLASASPARLRVLQGAGLAPEVVVSGVDEDVVEGSPEHVASTLAAHKAEAVVARLGGGAAVVVGCDSVLDLDGEPLGKPSSAADAVRRWQHMRGRTGHLLTGHCLIRTDTQRRAATVIRTKVSFGHPSDDEIAAYVATGEPQQVAGAFTIDGYGGWFVDRLEGDPSNVIGISLPAVRGLLAQLDVSITTLW